MAIIWILYSAAVCIADGFYPVNLGLDSGAVSITSVSDQVTPSCVNATNHSVTSESSNKQAYTHGASDYIDDVSITIDQEDQMY